MVSDFAGNRFDLHGPEILASNGKLHSQILKTI
jgi:hypothetical protein